MSFHIASQTVEVPALGLSISFMDNAEDTSKVICEIASSGHTDLDEDGKPDGTPGPAHVLTLCFNRGGTMLYKRLTDPDGAAEHTTVGLTPIYDPGDPKPIAPAVVTTEKIAAPEPAHDDTDGDHLYKPDQPIREYSGGKPVNRPPAPGS